MKRLLKFVALGAVLSVLLAGIVGCTTETKTVTEKPKTVSLIEKVTKDNPIVVDKANKKVYIYTTVNGKYFTEPSIHWGIAFKDGKVASKALFVSYASHEKFYDALTAIGAKPGNNLNTTSSDGQTVAGDTLKVTATWGDHKELALSKVINDSTGAAFDIKFGGNLEAAKTNNTGCITCLESCPIAISSNAAHPSGGYKAALIKYTGNSANLPESEGAVIFTYSLN